MINVFFYDKGYQDGWDGNWAWDEKYSDASSADYDAYACGYENGKHACALTHATPSTSSDPENYRGGYEEDREEYSCRECGDHFIIESAYNERGYCSRSCEESRNMWYDFLNDDREDSATHFGPDD